MKYKDFFNSGSKSDKIKHHGYHRIYPWFLNNFLYIDNVSILEIGVDEQNSISLWRDFFKGADITVMDIDQKSVEDAKFIKLDQSSREELKNYANLHEECHHIIVDDGSHVPQHQILTLVNLWQTLKPGGVYIVEDIETSYWGKAGIYGYRFDSGKINFVESVIQCVHQVNSEFILTKYNKIKSNALDVVMKDVEMVTFAYNCIIFVKKSPEFSIYYNREYILKNYVLLFKRNYSLKNIFNKIKDKIGIANNKFK